MVTRIIRELVDTTTDLLRDPYGPCSECEIALHRELRECVYSFPDPLLGKLFIGSFLSHLSGLLRSVIQRAYSNGKMELTRLHGCHD